MKRTVVAAALLLAACGHGPRLWLAAPEQSDAERLVVQADAAARARDNRRARDLYQEVLRNHPDADTGPRALYGLALLYVDPESPFRDSGAARRLFARLTSRYPDSPWTREARAWQATLAELVRQDAEVARLRGDMKRLKDLDLEMEGR